MFEVPKPPNRADPSRLLQSTSRSRTGKSSILSRNACREPFLKQPDVLGTDAAAAAYKAHAHLRPPPGLSRKDFGGNHVYKLPVGHYELPRVGVRSYGPRPVLYHPSQGERRVLGERVHYRHQGGTQRQELLERLCQRVGAVPEQDRTPL